MSTILGKNCLEQLRQLAGAVVELEEAEEDLARRQKEIAQRVHKGLTTLTDDRDLALFRLLAKYIEPDDEGDPDDQ